MSLSLRPRPIQWRQLAFVEFVMRQQLVFCGFQIGNWHIEVVKRVRQPQTSQSSHSRVTEMLFESPVQVFAESDVQNIVIYIR